MYDPLTSAASQVTWKFVQGFLFGQLTFMIMAIFVVKYFFFDDASKPIYSVQSTMSEKLRMELNRKRELAENVLKNFKDQKTPITLAGAEVLSKIEYNLTEHLPETVDWLNVLVGQILHQYRTDLLNNPTLISKIETVLNSKSIPWFIGPITLTDLSFGQEFPNMSQFLIKRKSDSSGLYLEACVEYRDRITIAFDTSLQVGPPGVSVAALPVSLSVAIVRFNGRVVIEFNQSTDSPNILFSILPDFQLDLDVNSLLGHKTKVKDLPKLASMLVYRVKVLIYQYLVYPKGRIVNLPSLVKILNGLKPDSPPQAPAPASSTATTNSAGGVAQSS